MSKDTIFTSSKNREEACYNKNVISQKAKVHMFKRLHNKNSDYYQAEAALKQYTDYYRQYVKEMLAIEQRLDLIMLSCIYIETVFWALFYLTNGPDNCSSESLSKAKTLVILFAALIELNAFSSNEELINNAIKSGEKNYRYLKSEEEKGNLTNSPKWAAGMISKALAANYSNPEKADAVTKRIWPVNTAMCEEVVAIANKLITQK